MRIVIVEDEVKIREGMGKIIEAQTGHVIVGEAADGEEGLQMVLRFKPDLVITDILQSVLWLPVHKLFFFFQFLFDALQHIPDVFCSQWLQKIIIHSVTNCFFCVFKLRITAENDGMHLDPSLIKLLQHLQTTFTRHTNICDYKIRFENVEESENNIEQLCRSCGFEPGMKYEMFAGYIGAANVTYREVVEQEIVELKEKYRDFKIYLVYQENRQIFLIASCHYPHRTLFSLPVF